ncbi:MAG: type I restriction endonuclease subunit R [Candidatus Hydrogenedentales bacterium]|jgi:type I restriction enzyme R subunit
MNSFNIVSSDNLSTVVSEYAADYRTATSYQSEAALEKTFIQQLQDQGYDYINVRTEDELVLNLRRQLEKLNNYLFSDEEWERFFKDVLANKNETMKEKTHKIQVDYLHLLKQDDGSSKNIRLIDKKDIHNNRLQVLNQYEAEEGKRLNRYDVTVLVNGLPLVHIELKRRGVAIREAFNQINRYLRESFWSGSGLFEYVQLFVISNGTHTKYYSNTTRSQHLKEQGGGVRRSKKTSHSFEFTSSWSDGTNKNIDDLVDFTKTFFAKHTLLNVLTRYCVFTVEEMLLVMRPYQIAATERILNRIKIAHNYKDYGSIKGGGYIWHTTGSGKTLTSFKTAQLATALDYIDKVLFVVDRKDLDYQTMKEYDRFEKGAANSNNSTSVLEGQLKNPDTRIIITTIQKLAIFISRYKKHEIYNKRCVLIFDECHRSQFGAMHKAITGAFKQYHLFGFTGTPIFAKNAAIGGSADQRTTEQAFGDKLHTYTIVDAINDGNVLPFRIDYISTIRDEKNIEDSRVRAIDTEAALAAPERIHNVVDYVLEHFDQKTKRSEFYIHKEQRKAGFNSIFTAASIPMARQYYGEFKKQLAEKNRELKIAMIYSFAVNEEEPDEDFDNERLDQSARDALEAAIADYNKMFKTNFDTSRDRFENYYKDVARRVKDREVDMLIVVNMFLTGFDATTLNTLWVDKNLRLHGLIQAFSRTNRILNRVKTFGNIVCFRYLKEATDEAIALFGDKEAGGIVLLKTFEEYYDGYEDKGKKYPGYKALVEELQREFPLGKAIVGEEKKKAFIKLFGALLRQRNILTAFDEFEGREILSQRDLQDYQSRYIDLYQELRPQGEGGKENINDDIIFEMELIKQIEVNIDYILMLVAQYHESNCSNKEILATIDKAISSSIELRSKKELIISFVDRISAGTKVDEDWRKFVDEQKETDLSALIQEEELKEEETRSFVDNAFRDGFLKTTGMDIDTILPPLSRFGGRREKTKEGIIAKLLAFFEKYLGLV